MSCRLVRWLLGVVAGRDFLVRMVRPVSAEPWQQRMSTVAEERLDQPEREDRGYGGETDPVFGRQHDAHRTTDDPAELQCRLGSAEAGGDGLGRKVVLDRRIEAHLADRAGPGCDEARDHREQHVAEDRGEHCDDEAGGGRPHDHLRRILQFQAGADTVADRVEDAGEHAVARPQPGLISIAGGKYTTYRVMAADAVDAAAQDLGPIKESVTEVTPLVGADGYAAMLNLKHEIAAESGLPEWRIEHLLNRYGSKLYDVLALSKDDESLLEPVTNADEYLRCEIAYAVTDEGAMHLEDVLARRTRMSIETKHRGVDAAAEVADIIAPILGWTQEQRDAEVESYTERVAAEVKSQELDTDEASDAARLSAPDPRPQLRKVVATR